MDEHDLQWLIVQLRMSIAYLLSDSANELTKADAGKLLDEDASDAVNYPFDYGRIRSSQSDASGVEKP